MKPRTAKLILTLATAGVGALTDVAAQLAGGQLVNAGRSIIVGVVLGIFARVLGAGLAYLVTQAAAAEPPHQDQTS